MILIRLCSRLFRGFVGEGVGCLIENEGLLKFGSSKGRERAGINRGGLDKIISIAIR